MMKKFLYLFSAVALMGLFFSCSDDDSTPVIPDNNDTTVVADYPETAAVDGKIEILVKFNTTPCNDVVFVGSYIGTDGATDIAWSDANLSIMAKFAPVDGYEGWYQAEITPLDTANADNYVAFGKPVQLSNDGTFNWAYQWGTGSADDEGGVTFYGDTEDGLTVIEVENQVEPKLNFTTDAKVVYLESKNWKTDPCTAAKPNEAGSATFTLVCPATNQDGEAIVGVSVVGGFTDNAWTPGAQMMTKVDDTHYTYSSDVPAAFEYKYVMSLDLTADWSWDNDELVDEFTDGGNRAMPETLQAEDTVELWGPKHVADEGE